MTAHWYALHVKPHKERFVYERLPSPESLASLLNVEAALSGIQMFFPSVRVKPVNPGAAKICPNFLGCLSVYSDLEIVGDAAFSWASGAHGLVCHGDVPVVVPESLIHELKERMAQLATTGVLLDDRYMSGDPVRITGGSFAGYEAIFDARLPGRERVQVLLAFLSSYPQRVQLPADEIEKVKKP